MAQQNSLLPAHEEPEQTLPPAPNAGLTPTDIQRVGSSLDSSVSDNTRAMYASAWRSFKTWAQARGALDAVHRARGHQDQTIMWASGQ